MILQERKLIAVVGLAQAGAVCAAAAACRIALRLAGSASLRILRGTEAMADWGLLLLVLPVAWTVWAVWSAHKDQANGPRWVSTLVAGILLAAVVLGYGLVALTRPLWW